MNQILIAFLTIILTGCVTLNDGIRMAAETNDKAVKTAEFTICYGATIGSIRRSYGSPDRQQVWKDLCNGKDNFVPVRIGD